MFDLLAEIKQTLSNNKLRTGLTGFAVAWGVFILVVLLGAAKAVEKSFDENLNSTSSNTISVYGGTTTLPHKGFREGRFIQLEVTDAQPLADKSQYIKDVISVGADDTVKVRYGEEFIRGIEAVSPKVQEIEELSMLCGRYINERDMELGRRVIVLGERNAERLFPTAEDALNKTVTAMGLTWKVVGVYKSRWKTNTYIPFNTYKNITGGDMAVGSLTAVLDGVSSAEEAVEAENDIRAALAQRHNFDAQDPNAVWVWNMIQNALQTSDMASYLSVGVWVLGFLTLLTGMVGVSNIMFVSVRERTHEIGIRRAIGAKPRSILLQVVCESVAISALFGYIGIIMGALVLQGLSTLTEGTADMGMMDPRMDLALAFKVLAALIAAGAVAGLFPAIKATKVKPVEALRDE